MVDAIKAGETGIPRSWINLGMLAITHYCVWPYIRVSIWGMTPTADLSWLQYYF